MIPSSSLWLAAITNGWLTIGLIKIDALHKASTPKVLWQQSLIDALHLWLAFSTAGHSSSSLLSVMGCIHGRLNGIIQSSCLLLLIYALTYQCLNYHYFSFSLYGNTDA